MLNNIKIFIKKILYYKTVIKYLIYPNVTIGKNSRIESKAILKTYKGKLIIGENSIIMKYSYIDCSHSKINIGSNCVIQPFALLLGHTGLIKIGDFTWINSFTTLAAYGEIEIGRYCGIAGHTIILAESHSYENPEDIMMLQPLEKRKVIIQDNVWIGANCTILGNVCIGEGSIIGANSFVNKDIPPYSIAVGSPVKIIKNRKNKEV
ncbi:MAG TPA: acyltransferase [bacterium]|nr:acyltransferase [bacterium]